MPVACEWRIAAATALFHDLMQIQMVKDEKFVANRGRLDNSNSWRETILRSQMNGSSQKLPEALITKLSDFVIFLQNLHMKSNYELGSIFACDETVCLVRYTH